MNCIATIFSMCVCMCAGTCGVFLLMERIVVDGLFNPIKFNPTLQSIFHEDDYLFYHSVQSVGRWIRIDKVSMGSTFFPIHMFSIPISVCFFKLVSIFYNLIIDISSSDQLYHNFYFLFLYSLIPATRTFSKCDRKQRFMFCFRSTEDDKT